VSSNTPDPVSANNTAGATFTATASGRMTVVSIKLQPPNTIPVTVTCANVATCAGTATITLAEDARNGSNFLPAGTVIASGPFSVANGTATFQLTRGSNVPEGLLESSKPLVTVTLTPVSGSPTSATMQLRPGNSPKG
jgi:Flp pilus assembly protein TadG